MSINKRTIVYGDIHGCLSSFQALRKKINVSSHDYEISVGDFITRGPKSIETLRYLKDNGISSVKGNHEDKIARYIEHSSKNYPNPIILNEDEKNIVDSMTLEDIDFLMSLPSFKKLNKVTVLHAGLMNKINLDNLSKDEVKKIMRFRYLSPEGKFIPYGEENENSIFWADIYDGNQGFVVYGHHNFDDVRVNENSLGIDTGCIYGNKLTAAIFEDTNKLNYNIIQTE